MLDYWWIEKDLIDTDAKAMGVYLALLYLRLRKDVTFTAKPSGLDIMNESRARELIAFYLAGKGEDARAAYNAAVTFIDRLFTREDMLDWSKRNPVLEDIECRYYNKFVSAFKKYLRLNVIPDEFREMAKNVLLDIRSQLYEKAKTRCGTVEIISGGSLEDNIKKYYGMKDEEVKKLISNLIKSGLIYQEYPYVLIIPSPCLSDEIVELIVKGGVKPEVKPPTPPPVVPTSERIENLIRAKPSREILEGIVASVLEDLGFNVQTNVRLPARGGEVEVDVWAFKSVGGSQFRVYVSCKNWDRDVDRHVVDQEFGRVLQLDYMPHLRVLMVRSLTEPARKAALDDGFMVIELGRKAEAENSREVYEIVYKAFNELFTAIAPPRLREIADRLAEIRENLRRVEEEISKLLYR
jgi:hypothetical protein